MRFDIIEFDRSYGTSAQLKRFAEPEIVFSGRSNVGKSSLMNKLFNRKNLARVSSVPGKTVTVNFFKGDKVNFVDLPGYGYAKAAKSEKLRWADLMEGYFGSERNIALVVQLIDSRHKPSKDDYDMLNFLKAVFQNNVTFNTNEDFRSQFNSDWAGKLLIVVDEVLLNRRENSERLKNLSTTLSYKVEAKGKDRDEIAFFAKFVLCSNNESLPVIIDPGETRYWVRKIHRLESDDTNFLQKLTEEIPAFLYFLQHRKLTTRQESRMWFSPKLTETPALLRIIRCNRGKHEVEAMELIREIMDNMGIESFSFCLNDLINLLNLSGVKIEKYQLRRIVTESWKLTPAPNGLTYTSYQFEYNKERRFAPIRRVGRFYTVSRLLLDEL